MACWFPSHVFSNKHPLTSTSLETRAPATQSPYLKDSNCNSITKFSLSSLWSREKLIHTKWARNRLITLPICSQWHTKTRSLTWNFIWSAKTSSMKFIDLRVLQHHPAVFSQTVSRTIPFLQEKPLLQWPHKHLSHQGCRTNPCETGPLQYMCVSSSVTLLPTLLFCENRISRSVRQMKLLNKAKGKKKICSIIGTSTNNAPTLSHIYLPIKSKQNSTNFNCQIK